MSAATLFRQRTTLLVGGVPCLFTTYWDDVAIVGGTALATEACARVRAMFSSLASTIAAGVTISFDTTVVQMSQTTGQPTGAFVATPPASVTPVGAAQPLPLATQALARWDTGIYIRGRRLVGKSFLPGFMESGSDTGVGPNSSLTTALNTAIGLLGTVVSSNIRQVVWSRPNPAVPGSGQAEAVTSRTVSPSWAVQRGRRP